MCGDIMTAECMLCGRPPALQQHTRAPWQSKGTSLPRTSRSRVCMALPPLPTSANDPFLARLAAAASTELGKEQLAQCRSSCDGGPPLLDLVAADTKLMAAPAQVCGVLPMCLDSRNSPPSSPCLVDCFRWNVPRRTMSTGRGGLLQICPLFSLIAA